MKNSEIILYLWNMAAPWASFALFAFAIVKTFFAAAEPESTLVLSVKFSADGVRQKVELVSYSSHTLITVGRKREVRSAGKSDADVIITGDSTISRLQMIFSYTSDAGWEVSVPKNTAKVIIESQTAGRTSVLENPLPVNAGDRLYPGAGNTVLKVEEVKYRV